MYIPRDKVAQGSERQATTGILK